MVCTQMLKFVLKLPAMQFNIYNYTSRQQEQFIYDNPFDSGWGKAFNYFHQFYEPIVTAHVPASKMRLSRPAIKTCLFCGRTDSETKFKKTAHVIPELLGNQFLVHHSECDACNLKFGVYESSLANYIGMMRTADGMKGKNGIPTYISKDEKLKLTYEVTKKGERFISVYDNRETDDRLPDGKSVYIRSSKAPYIPLHVMKSFYKMAYNVLPEISMSDHKLTLDIVTTEYYDTKLASYAYAMKFTLPQIAETPCLVLFQKKKEFRDTFIPSTIATLHFGRFIYEYIVPNNNDVFLYEPGGKGEIIFCPAFYQGDQREVKVAKVDLSSPDKKYNESDDTVFTFDKR